MNLASVYTGIEDYKKAVELCLQALDMNKHHPVTYREIEATNFLLGDIMFKTRQYDKARVYYTKSERLIKQMKSRENLADIYLKLFQLDSISNNAAGALKNYQLHVKYKDSLFNQNNLRMAALYKIKFDVEQHEAENKRLKILEEKNATTIKSQRAMLAIAIVCLLIIGAGIVYLRKINYKIKARNRVISVQNQLLESNYKVKDQLFTVVSHDLRSPVAQIVSLLNVWEMGDLSNEEVAALIPRIKNATNNTLQIMDGLLVWSKKQLQGYKFNPEKLDVNILTSEVTENIQSAITGKHQMLVNRLTSPVAVFADKEMVTVILRNLLANATKFAPDGGTITINTIEADGFITVSIADTGVGMSSAKVKNLFNQASSSTLGTAGEKGTGLGLKLCKDFTEMNGGRIWAESKEEEGSTFFFSLPTQELI